MTRMSDAEARQALGEHLRRDADAHEAERFDEIGRRFDAFERAFPNGDEDELRQLTIAMLFWDGWIEARNYGWQAVSGIRPNEWPGLAREVAADLMAGRDITNARVRDKFNADRTSSLGDRVQTVAERLRGRNTIR
jgi:hypothetical protein